MVAIVALLTAGSASAQFRFGIKAGVNVNKLHFENSFFDTDNRAGFTGGLMTEFQIPVIGLCFDASLMYARMSSQVDVIDVPDEGAEEVKSHRDFLEIPINIKYKIGIPVVRKIITPYIFTGPSFAFKLGGNKDVFKTKTFQCGWNLGLGVELVNHLQVSGGYTWGINNIADKVMGINASDEIKVHNSYWTITAAYLF